MKDILTDAQEVADNSPRDAITLARFLDAAGHTAAAIALANLCGEYFPRWSEFLMTAEILPDYVLQCEQCGRSSTDDAVGFCGDCCRCDNCCRCNATYSVTALAHPNGAAGLPLPVVLARGVTLDDAVQVAATARARRGRSGYSRVRVVLQQ